jgi:cysteine--tRNA ligase
MSMLQIYNTLTRKKEAFRPLNPQKVGIYACGMTVYDYCHLGHGRLMVVFDTIVRWIRHLGYPNVTYVRNITDIDDKIIAAAKQQNTTAEKIACFFSEAMHEDEIALGNLLPDKEPRVTDFIPQIIAMIAQLIENKKAYVAENKDVYYAVKEFLPYGQLSGKNLSDLRAGERVEVNDAKKDPLDFVLWKAAKSGEPYWDSPWGKGRPGWHIECSAMSQALLGENFDIHGGGADLQFPHHENELAQSCGVTDQFALQSIAPKIVQSHVRYWMHNGFIRIDNEKMSKSLGNFFTLRELLQQYPGEVIRFFLLKTHYRSPLNYTEQHLNEAKNALTRLYTALKNTPPADRTHLVKEHDSAYSSRFYRAMNDDFNTTEAIAVLFEMATQINKQHNAQLAGELKALANLLGFLQDENFLLGKDESDTAWIDTLIAQRAQARLSKDWAKSDEIRDTLLAKGIVLEDGPQGTSWRKEA